MASFLFILLKLSVLGSVLTGLLLLVRPLIKSKTAAYYLWLLVLVRLMHELVQKNSQFLICTHSPILLCFPGADVYELSTTPGEAFRQLPFEQTQLFRLYQGILRAPQKVMRELLK